MTGVAGELEWVFRSLSLPVPDGLPPDLGSPDRTHVFVAGDVVFKCDAANRVGSGSMMRERQALELLRGASGLAVPELLHAGELDDGRHWVLLRRLDGSPPDDATRLPHELSAGLAAQLGAVVARLHEAVVPPAFGTWSVAPRRTFLEEQRHRIGILESMAREARIVPDEEIDELLGLLHRTAAPLAAVTTPVLAHRDVQPRNVLVDDGHLTALLDFESSAGGDPAEDFRVLALDWDTEAFAAFAGAYVNALGRSLDASFADRVAHYVLQWVFGVFAYLGRIVPTYLDPARTAVARVRAGDRPPLPDQNTSRRNPSA